MTQVSNIHLDRGATPHQPLQTTRALLQSVLMQPPLAVSPGSNRTHVYDLGVIPSLEDYVLRVTESGLSKLLRHSTSLIPVEKLVRGMHIGQPLLELDSCTDITINLKQKGTTLSTIKKSYEKYASNYGIVNLKEQRDFTTAKLLERLLALQTPAQPNPFTAILDQAYLLCKEGYFCDLNLGNILLDDQSRRLTLVDQLEAREGESHSVTFNAAVGRLLSALNIHPNQSFLSHPNTEYNALSDQTRTMIMQAKKQVLSTHSKEPSTLRYARVSDVKAVSLDDPPHMLVEMLREMQQRAVIPAR